MSETDPFGETGGTYEQRLGAAARRFTHEVAQPLTSIVNYARGCLHRLESQGEAADLEVVAALERAAGEAARATELLQGFRRELRRLGREQAPTENEL